MTSEKPTRVVILQPSLAKYRVPVYRRLAQTPGLDLKLVYGQDQGIPNVEPDGFNASFAPHRHLKIAKRRLFVWSSAQLKYADPRHADVLVLVWNSRWLSLPLALRKARKNGVRTVVWGHGYSKNESPWRAKLRRRLGLQADAMLFYSASVAKQYEQAGVPKNRIFVAPNSLDQAPIAAARDAWESNPQRLDAFRREHGVTPDQTPILYVSRFDPANRVDLLLRAAAQIAPQHPGLRLHLVGKGEPEMSRLQSLTRELGLTDRVRFLGPIYDEDQLAPWFLTAKAFCYPSNIGLSILHAMGYGLPVITADDIDSQNPEFEALEAGHNGLVYPPNDTSALAATMDRLLSDPALGEKLGHGARETIATRYNLEAMTSGYLAALAISQPKTESP